MKKRSAKKNKIVLEKSAKQKAFLPFIALFAVLGGILIILSYAAVQKDYTIEPENGTFNAAIVALTDTGTGASYVTNKLCDTGFVGTPPNCVEAGWTAQYYANTALSGTPRITRAEADVNFNYAAGSPDANIPVDGFSARFTRTQTLAAGMYMFTTTSDDGVRVTVDGKSVINNWTDHGQTTDTGMIDLTAGTHTIVVEYYENGGDAIISLTYGIDIHSHLPTAPAGTTNFTQNFDTGTTAASVNMTDMSGSGIPVHINPDGTPFLGKITIANGRVGTDPNPQKHDNYAVANGTFSADQYAEADLIIGSSVANQYTGVDVRANLTGPIYSWYKLETVSSTTQMRILALQNNRIAAEYYADIPGGLRANTTNRIRLEVQGTTLRAFFNGSPLTFRLPNGSLSTNVTDTNIANGKPGLHVDGFQTWIDNFSAGSLGTVAVTTPTPTTPTTPTPAPTTPNVPTTTQTGGPYINNALIPAASPGDSQRRYTYSRGNDSYNADGVGAFRTWCYYSHMNYDDPIVYPGQVGKAHLHTFFGNTSVNAYTTAGNITTTGNSTCSGGIINRSAYWIPSLIDGSGRPMVPSRLTAYYKTGYRGVSPSSVVVPPPGLRMIAGDASRTTPDLSPWYDQFAGWNCASRLDGSGVSGAGPGIPSSCPSNSYLELRVDFPQCWNGRDLDSADHKSHMAYGTYPAGCPSSHPVALPAISVHVYWEPSGDQTAYRLSSDKYTGGTGGWSVHSDWFNGWDQSVLDTVRTNCWLTGLDCRVNGIGPVNQGLTCDPNLLPTLLRSIFNVCYGP